MHRSASQLRAEASAIWQAGWWAVETEHLVRQHIRVEGTTLRIGDEIVDLSRVERIGVVGAGKAGAAMAAGFEAALGPDVLAIKEAVGWINVPANTVRRMQRLYLHPARPAGSNMPTQAGVDGARQLMWLASQLGENDLCVALISGGGSALLPLPIDGVTLDDKLAVTEFLTAAGAPIEELNVVRTQLSRIKGGGLARACRAGRLIVLVVSDVPGDRLDVIASGPTVAAPSTPAEALAILDRYRARAAGIAPRVFEALAARGTRQEPPITCRVVHQVLANNARAVDAAGLAAEKLGYSHAMTSALADEGTADEVGQHLAALAISMRDSPGPDCLISGGEPTVQLVDKLHRGKGGRNQQLVVAAAERLTFDGGRGICILSMGTDGEDGPTDAAGGYVDGPLIVEASRRGLNPRNYLARNDAYNWLEPIGGLIKTGPTGTNVCDLRVVLVDRIELTDRK